jgi:hypothetical protein
VFADVLAAPVEDDGVRFDPSTLEVGPIREDQEYGGVRVILVAQVPAPGYDSRSTSASAM